MRWMRKTRIVWFLLLCCGLVGTIALGRAASPIHDYQVIFKPYLDRTGQVRIAVRRFEWNGETRFLTLQPFTLATEVQTAATVDFSKTVDDSRWQISPFWKALAKHTAAPYPDWNDGVTGADHPGNGVFLTVDMCPSTRDFEKNLFVKTMELPQGKTAPVPVAIALTGAWLTNHHGELQWLREQEAAGRLKITWINHSYSHPYDKGLPNAGTFLLTSGLDARFEVLAMEQLMLANGITPSPFFRFPGLTSNRELLEMLKELSLIPIGSNAWLALGHTAKPGSIILVHGNGNEPKGIELLLAYYQNHQNEFAQGKLWLLPVATAF